MSPHCFGTPTPLSDSAAISEDIVAEAVLSLDEDKRAAGGLDIVTSLLRRLEEQSPAGRIPDDQLAEPVRMLEAIRPVRPDGTYAPVELPLDTTA